MKQLQTVVLTGYSDVLPAEGARQIENFKIEDYPLSPKTYLDRASALALAGGALALRDAGIRSPVENADQFGLTLGTHLGCLETMKGFWEDAVAKGVRLAKPLLFSHSYVNSPISLCAIEFGLKGYHATFCAGRNSGLEAVRAGFDAIRLGHAQAILCGGVEALTPARQTCEAGDLGEASVFFVLESQQRAGERGRLEISDEMLNEAAQNQNTIERFGDCGGATGTLELLEILKQKV
jgi:hypothetical protein